MPSFSGIHLALQALLTHQYSMEVIEHNVANVNTEGYHRQEAVLQAGPTQGSPGVYSTSPSSQIGTGVVLKEVRRYSLEFTESRYRNELAEMKRWEIMNNYLQQVESALSEVGDDGLSAKLDAFWDGWKDVSANPEDLTQRMGLLENAKDLAEAFNTRVQNLTDLRRDQNLSIIQRVNEVNELAEQVAQLNVEIGKFTKSSMQPNDFLDQQALYLDRLSEIAGAKISFEQNGQAMVSIGGHMLVQGSSVHKLETVPEPTNFNLVDIYWEDGMPLMEANGVSTIPSGELAGLREVRDEVIQEQIDRLNNLALSLIEEVNSLHENAYGLNDTADYDPTQPAGSELSVPGRQFFTTAPPIYDPNHPALSITVNSELEDVANIAISTSIEVPDPPPTVFTSGLAVAPGDGSIAEAMYNLRYAAVDFGTGSSLVNDTFNNYNNVRVSGLGLTISRVNTMQTQHENLLTVMEEKMDSVSGVSLDEEAANLIKYQRSYQAAIRIMNTMDEILEQVVTSLGLAGR